MNIWGLVQAVAMSGVTAIMSGIVLVSLAHTMSSQEATFGSSLAIVLLIVIFVVNVFSTSILGKELREWVRDHGEEE